MTQIPDTFKFVSNIWGSRLRKFLHITLDPYKPWWWGLNILVLIILVILCIYLLPLFWPENFTESRSEKQFSSELTLFYYPRVVAGHDYPVRLVHTLQQPPITIPASYVFILKTSWGGGYFIPSREVFIHDNVAPIADETLLHVENAKPPSNILTLIILDENNIEIGSEDISILKLPDIIAWSVVPLSVTGLSLLRSIIISLGYLWKKAFEIYRRLVNHDIPKLE